MTCMGVPPWAPLLNIETPRVTKVGRPRRDARTGRLHTELTQTSRTVILSVLTGPELGAERVEENSLCKVWGSIYFQRLVNHRP